MKSKIKMKLVPLTALALSVYLSISGHAASLPHGAPCVKGEAYNWYCVHTKNETVPTLDPSFSFIEEYGGYYVDKTADAGCKTIYLTFDAGYENGNVEKVLDVLKSKGVRGSFFILENLALKNGELVKRMADEGHLVCNHTATHRDISTMSSIDDLRCELDRLNDAVKENCGVEVAKFFRPPEGRFNEKDLEWASSLGYKTVFWSFAFADWDNNKQPEPAAALKKILDGAHPGEILLLHPTSSTNAVILADLIDALTSRGYVFKTLDEMPE